MNDVPPYRTRLVDRVVSGLLAELPALLLTGPRASGKTTTAARFAATVVRLDHAGEAAAFRADPDAALRDLPEPVVAAQLRNARNAVGESRCWAVGAVSTGGPAMGVC